MQRTRVNGVNTYKDVDCYEIDSSKPGILNGTCMTCYEANKDKPIFDNTLK